MIGQSVIGLFVFVVFSWIISEDRRKARFRPVIAGLSLQLAIAAFFLKVPVFKDLFLLMNKGIIFLEEAAGVGTAFVFGYLGGGDLPFDEKVPGAGYILAFRALPLVLVISAISSLLFYWRVLPYIVRMFSWMLQKTMGIGGAEGVGVAANIFTGMIEAPIFIRPYLKDMERSELFTVMTCGMATIAGTVMALYAAVLSRVVPDITGHILTASIISAPAAVTVSKLMVPGGNRLTKGSLIPDQAAQSSMDAISRGTIDGVKLIINIIAMLIVLIALVYIVNGILGILPDFGGSPVTLQRILGYIMAPVVWLMGIPWAETLAAGSVMGTKTVLNEFIAYIELANLPESVISQKSRLILVYALCGFANFGSLGIMIGGLGSMVPERKQEILSLGVKSIIAGTISTCMTGAVVGILTG